MTANMFGLGNAATPMGIKAMEEMKKISNSPVASRSMITFLALNTSSLTLIPTKVIAIRMQYGSVSPTEIVGTTIVATIISTLSAILLDRFFYHTSKDNKLRSMMVVLTTISAYVSPSFILIVLLVASVKKLPTYELFVEGGKEGIQMTFTLLPFLLGMIVSISILRSSGALEAFIELITPLLIWLGIPPEILPLAIIRPISGSAALGMKTELTQNYDPES